MLCGYQLKSRRGSKAYLCKVKSDDGHAQADEDYVYQYAVRGCWFLCGTSDQELNGTIF